jgi:hypothetical protein
MSQTSVTRSQYEPIQWDFCFICQNKTFKKDLKVHKIAPGERVNKLMECALSQNDDRLVRVLNCDDFVLKGVYHNGCMTKYLLKSSPKNEQKQDSELSSNEIAFQNLIHEINDDLVVHKKVFRMTQLLEKYKAYLPANTDTYSSAKIQDRLVKHYAGSIVIRGQGMSNLVVSDKLSSGDSIGAAGKYKSKFKASELENDFEVNVEGISYEQILHSAVGILRRDIEKLKISVGDYPKKPNYSNLNKFRVRLAAKKEGSLAKLPPYEATFHQHVLRASLQTYIWKSSQKAHPLLGLL